MREIGVILAVTGSSVLLIICFFAALTVLDWLMKKYPSTTVIIGSVIALVVGLKMMGSI